VGRQNIGVRIVKNNLVVRDATQSDILTTAQIVAAEGTDDVDTWYSRFADALADDSRHFVVAELDGAVVGFGQSRYVARGVDVEWPPSGWFLSGLTVSFSARRLGIGTLLTKDRLERLRATTEVVYYAADDRNGAVRELHRRLGFLPIGTIRLSGEKRELILEKLEFFSVQ
jgi:ribosomal protein S18 acetylase RimI-like enzyme